MSQKFGVQSPSSLHFSCAPNPLNMHGNSFQSILSSNKVTDKIKSSIGDVVGIPEQPEYDKDYRALRRRSQQSNPRKSTSRDHKRNSAGLRSIGFDQQKSSAFVQPFSAQYPSTLSGAGMSGDPSIIKGLSNVTSTNIID